jgi:hypothetical protein
LVAVVAELAFVAPVEEDCCLLKLTSPTVVLVAAA